MRHQTHHTRYKYGRDTVNLLNAYSILFHNPYLAQILLSIEQHDVVKNELKHFKIHYE
jgi:hypothetical protein